MNTLYKTFAFIFTLIIFVSAPITGLQLEKDDVMHFYVRLWI